MLEIFSLLGSCPCVATDTQNLYCNTLSIQQDNDNMKISLSFFSSFRTKSTQYHAREILQYSIE
jgi:hypothetical protein